jgi:3-hydroxyisobutyrate dehydrogenase-like beta-hydroxyacid dehydrogenase
MQHAVIGIISPGDMGSAIGRMLRAHGIDAITCLEGRGALTRLRAKEAGLREVGGFDELVREAGLVLSVLVPAEAVGTAERLATSIRRTGARPVVADCNAVSPATVARIARLITDSGAPFVDAGIIGPPPQPGRNATRIYCSGPDCDPLLALNESGLEVRQVGSAIGQASGLKMVYAASTKGTTALWTELLVATRALGLDDALAAEFALSRSEVAQRLIGQIPGMPRRARRWVGEMEEIAATFAELGLTPRMLLGAADMYRFVGETSLADQTSRAPDPSLDAILATLADRLMPVSEQDGMHAD